MRLILVFTTKASAQMRLKRFIFEQVALADGGSEVQLLNPNGLQLLTQTHLHRAPDKRLGEPEELLKDRCAPS